MANIYLRLPLYLAEYYRGRNPKIMVRKENPIVFPPFTEEWNILRNGCALVDMETQRNMHCYSQASWKQFLSGTSANGLRVYRPFRDTIPTIEEMSVLEGCHVPKRSDRVEYLCICLPKTVWIGEKEVNVNQGFSLLTDSVSELTRKMREDFIRAFTVFVCGYMWSCYSNGLLHVSKNAAINRFCVNYNISCDETDVENLRKLLMRYMKRWPRTEYMQIDAEAHDFASHIDTDKEDESFDVMQFIRKNILERDDKSKR